MRHQSELTDPLIISSLLHALTWRCSFSQHHCGCRGSKSVASWGMPSINISIISSPMIAATVSVLTGDDLMPAGFLVSFQLPEAALWKLQGSWQNQSLDLPASLAAVQQLLQPEQRLVSSSALQDSQLQGAGFRLLMETRNELSEIQLACTRP